MLKECTVKEYNMMHVSQFSSQEKHYFWVNTCCARTRVELDPIIHANKERKKPTNQPTIPKP